VFARVALPAALPEALSYSIPSAIAHLVVPGVRVRVRLRGLARVGLVVDVAADPGCPPEKVLPVGEVLDAAPLLPHHLLDLVRFAADYYAAPLGSVVRTAIPAQLLRLPPPLVRLGPQARTVLASAQPAERRLLERLFEVHRLTVATLRAEGWTRSALEGVLERLQDSGAVEVVERRPRSEAGGTVTAVSLADLAPAEREDRVGRAPAQQRVLAWLVELGRPALEGELRAACGCSPGVIRAMVDKGVLRRFPQRRATSTRRWELTAPPPPTTLTGDQEAIVGSLADAVGAGRFSATLLFGVTGSGKTEVYLRLVAAAVERGLRALVLVPEIGLTPALAGQLSGRFGERVAVLHSSMAEGERFAAWERARRGNVDVVAGPRSALWAPLEPLGLIVVDEEQDSSYKQEEEPRYNARDLAFVLARDLRIPLLLASATPSLEVLHLADQGRVEVRELRERVAGGTLPEVEVVDLRGEEAEAGEHGQRFLSARLRELLSGVAAAGEQAIVLVNRRGWAPVLLCRECGHQAACGECSIPMTVHRRRNALICHYCGARRTIPTHCPRCGGAVLDHIGAGTEKIASRVRELFPQARVDILDRDTARSPAQLVATLERFAAGATDVLVGTQMVSKGHHFPNVTLTAVVNADNLLGFPDFRGAERTFQMLTQVAGRAGRGEAAGRVVIQTYHPDHHAVRAALTHDVHGFVREESRYRKAFGYPPWTRMVLVRYESARENAAMDAGQGAAAALEPSPPGLRLLGPALAPLARLRGRWRVQLLLLAPGRRLLREAVEKVLAVPVRRGVHRVVDVDPQSTV
jgi:primosomal protein N' (replication factor Y) (superfamily II helicase)